jgi:hypothetical protein
MPAHRTLGRESTGSPWFRYSAISLLVILGCTCTVALMPASKVTEPSESASVSAIIINAGDGALVSVDPKMRLPPVWVDGTLTPGADKILKEIGKQAIDQPGHVLMGAGPIWASRYLIGVPWYGWVVTPLLAYREWLQWPSKRWWDPPLDWAFLSLGVVAATWGR